MLRDHFNYIPSNEPTLADDEYELRADKAYYVQVGEHDFIAHNPKGVVHCRELKEAMQDVVDSYLRQNKGK